MTAKIEVKTQYGFFIDTTKCSGCKTCHVSCKDRSDVPVDVIWRRVKEFTINDWTANADGSFDQNVKAYYASLGCNHCDNPACTKVCPVGAHAKHENGFVLIDQTKCIACRACESACPYGAPQFDKEKPSVARPGQKGVMTKCDGCNDRVAKGLKPICVESCLMRALDFGLIKDLRQKYGSNADIQPLPRSSQTSPNIVIKANPAASGNAMLTNPTEVGEA